MSLDARAKTSLEREAQDYIAGYTIMNDFSARDIQFQEMACRLGPAKGKDFATALGPCLVTPDEITDLSALTMIARVNGEEWSRGRFGTIHWSFSANDRACFSRRNDLPGRRVRLRNGRRGMRT